MSTIVAELQAKLRDSEAVATLAVHTRDAILEVGKDQAKLLNCASFGALESAGTEKQWFQLGPEEVFFLCHALKCVAVESENRARVGAPELWDLLASTSEQFPEMYRAYEHLRLKNWVVKSGLQKALGTRCDRMQDWSELLSALRASGSVAKTLLVLTISTESSELGSMDCLEQMIVHERTITRWIPQQCRERREETNRNEQRQKSCREVSNEEQEHTFRGVVFSYWGVVLSFTVLSSLLVYKLKF
ncbi:unnamed protein product [Miscanthus lutarioriparius]|uniref:Uncharacterized protein n=1 Tax=Miscanthus lutarioriparius TaxID=422564 RepID=A0A811S169_9POAL|nr:unnamed protein product [Miscanthus lutarioriparius]